MMLSLSVLLHAGAALFGHQRVEPPKLLPIKSGRASISLRSSIGASPKAGGGGISPTRDLLAALPDLPQVKGIENAPKPEKDRPPIPLPMAPQQHRAELPKL